MSGAVLALLFGSRVRRLAEQERDEVLREALLASARSGRPLVVLEPGEVVIPLKRRRSR